MPQSKILFLTQLLPHPLDSGAKVRAYYMLRHLAQDHRVTLVSFVRAEDSPAAVDHLRTICHEVHTVPMRRSLARNLRAGVRGLLSGRPIVIVRDEIQEMYGLLAGLLQTEGFHLIHADQTSMAGYGLWAADHAPGARPATVLDQHNAVHLLAQRMAAEATHALGRAVTAREARAFVGYERSLCRGYDAILTVTPEDRDHHLALFHAAERTHIASKITPIPIAVDPDSVQPVAPAPRPHPPTILHLGTMFWPPNAEGVLWFVREVLPRVWQHVPAAHFVVVGKQPPPGVQALAADPRIQVTGYVADPQTYLAQADVFVVPLAAGGGMRVKILDAWLWGLPLVSTPLGAEGIEVVDGENILLAEGAEAFAQAVVHLLQDAEMNRSLRRAGRAWVEERYAWPVVYAGVEPIYARLLSQPAESAQP